MPGGTVFVWMSSIRTVVPFLAGWKTFVDQIGSVMSPAIGGVTEGSGRMSYCGNPSVVACASPCTDRVTVLAKLSLRDTVIAGPSTGVVVVLGRLISTGGTSVKSGICMTVPS